MLTFVNVVLVFCVMILLVVCMYSVYHMGLKDFFKKKDKFETKNLIWTCSDCHCKSYYKKKAKK